MKHIPYLIIMHNMVNDEVEEVCYISRTLKKKHMIKATVIINILTQELIKDDSDYGNDEELIDVFFSKYKEQISEVIATLVVMGDKYPYIAKQLEECRKFYE